MELDMTSAKITTMLMDISQVGQELQEQLLKMKR